MIKKTFFVIPAILAVGVWVFLTLDNGQQPQAACLGWGTDCEESVTVEVEVIPGDICIGTTGSFDFGTLTSSASAQSVTGAFTDEFWVEDLKGDDAGYYTTLQLSGDLQSGTNTIDASNVLAKTASTGPGAIVLMNGTANSNVEVDAVMATFQSLDGAVTFIKRDTGANSGLVWQYGALPEMRVDVPAYQPVGVYTGNMVYTLFEN